MPVATEGWTGRENGDGSGGSGVNEGDDDGDGGGDDDGPCEIGFNGDRGEFP